MLVKTEVCEEGEEGDIDELNGTGGEPPPGPCQQRTAFIASRVRPKMDIGRDWRFEKESDRSFPIANTCFSTHAKITK